MSDIDKIAAKLPLSKSTLERNPHLRVGSRIVVPAAGKPSLEVTITTPKKRIRQDTKPLMNKLETEYFRYLDDLYDTKPGNIKVQALRFKLGNGIWYKPDFVVFYEDAVIAYEVKGPFAHRGGLENLKVAASQYPEIEWQLVWKSSDGQWDNQVVLP